MEGASDGSSSSSSSSTASSADDVNSAVFSEEDLVVEAASSDRMGVGGVAARSAATRDDRGCCSEGSEEVQSRWLADFKVEENSPVPIEHEMGEPELHRDDLGRGNCVHRLQHRGGQVCTLAHLPINNDFITGDEIRFQIKCLSRTSCPISYFNVIYTLPVTHGAKAGPRGATCDTDEGSGEDAMILAAFLRKRSSQCLIAGAVVTATVVYALYRNRHRPRRPSPPSDGKLSDTAATAKKRWWRFAGRGRRGATQNEEMVRGGGEGDGGTGGKSGDGEGSAGSSNPELTQGSGESDTERDADRQTRPGQSGDDGSDGGGGELIGGRAKSDGQTSRDRKLVPLNFRDPAPTAFPSPEHHRERNVGTTGSWGGPGAEPQGFAPACGKIEGAEERPMMSSTVEGKGLVKEKGDTHTGGTGVKQRRDHSSVREDARAADTELPREISSLSESSTEDLLAEADSLIAADAKARKTSDTARTTLAKSSKQRSSGSASRLGNARATRPRHARGSSGGSGKSRGTTSGKSRSSQPRPPGASGGGASGRSSDPRMPKRARVYREVSGEEVDALVSLTHRALQLEPAALDEIAKDASRQQREDGESTPSVGELAANASVVWNTGDGGREAAARGRHSAALVATKSDLWGGREEAASNRPVLRS